MAALDPITAYYNYTGRYPANNQQWWLARADVDDSTRGLKQGDFMPELLQKLYMGNLHAPRGHFLLNAFNKDRAAVSGVAGIPAITTNARPSTVAFFSGRVWYACGSTVYFSQILTDITKAGQCYMDADPTSENISDPVATDGGVIPLPEAMKIIKLASYTTGVLVLATNGAWFITGTANGFSALNISVNKISPVGCQSPNSVVETETSVFWWSDIGIMGMSHGTFGQMETVNVNLSSINMTEPVIHTFYHAIPDDVRAEVRGVYDAKANHIHWLYRNETTPSGQFDRMLTLDIGLGAFMPWEFSTISGGPVIKGFYLSLRNNTYTIPTDIRPSMIEYLIAVPNGTTVTMRVAQARSGQFVDWYSYNNVGVTYDSYLETGYELFNDAMRKKSLTYLFSYLTRTGTTVVDGEEDYPSSCTVQVKWDWASGSQSNKWTTPVECYTPNGLFDNPDTGFGMVIKKMKVRGSGKAIQFRFGTSEPGKNFDLNGWAIAATGTPTP